MKQRTYLDISVENEFGEAFQRDGHRGGDAGTFAQCHARCDVSRLWFGEDEADGSKIIEKRVADYNLPTKGRCDL